MNDSNLLENQPQRGQCLRDFTMCVVSLFPIDTGGVRALRQHLIAHSAFFHSIYLVCLVKKIFKIFFIDF